MDINRHAQAMLDLSRSTMEMIDGKDEAEALSAIEATIGTVLDGILDFYYHGEYRRSKEASREVLESAVIISYEVAVTKAKQFKEKYDGGGPCS